jgi:hypothetical protein
MDLGLGGNLVIKFPNTLQEQSLYHLYFDDFTNIKHTSSFEEERSQGKNNYL